ncbi:LysR family transcriptional regulator [Ralstonia pickettii DTP0602]|nr:LysR family transcriptional regulator [Ralstonia pickettii DTP0602]
MGHAMQDVEPDLLRAFVAVAESGSFTAAAGLIGRSQSAVSQKVLRLEDVLDLRVFERSSRSLTLTRDGERALAAAKRLLGHYDAFLRELREPPKPALMRLGISENLVQTQLPRLLSRFSEQYPDVQIELATSASQDLLADYEAGALDVVIAKARKGGPAVRGRVIWREPLVWLAATGYRPDSRRPARLVMMRPPCAYREIMTDVLNDARREWVVACTASSLSGVQAAVLGGLGVTVLGKSFAQHGMRILSPSAQWPALPMAEVSVIGESPAMQPVIEPLVAMLTEALLESGSVTLETNSQSG